jgi:hypothetical protein
MDNYLIVNAVTDDNFKRAMLLTALDEEAYKLIFNLCFPTAPEDKSFTELTELFDKTCESAFVARQRFYATTRNSQESAAEFAARLRGLACKSEFPEAVLDMTLRNRFVTGFGKGPVQDRLFEEKISVSFADAVSVASSKMATHSLQQQVQVKLVV